MVRKGEGGNGGGGGREGVEGRAGGIVIQTCLLTRVIADSKKVANNRRGKGRGKLRPNSLLWTSCSRSRQLCFPFFHDCVRTWQIIW